MCLLHFFIGSGTKAVVSARQGEDQQAWARADRLRSAPAMTNAIETSANVAGSGAAVAFTISTVAVDPSNVPVVENDPGANEE